VRPCAEERAQDALVGRVQFVQVQAVVRAQQLVGDRG
jgi:hypothetical protein